MSAARTLILVAAESGSSAGQDRVEDLQVQPGEPLSAALEERVRRRAQDIGHLHGWPRHLLGVGRVRAGGEYGQRIQRTGGSAEMPLRQVEINGGLLEIAVAQQELDGA